MLKCSSVIIILLYFYAIVNIFSDFLFSFPEFYGKISVSQNILYHNRKDTQS